MVRDDQGRKNEIRGAVQEGSSPIRNRVARIPGEEDKEHRAGEKAVYSRRSAKGSGGSVGPQVHISTLLGTWHC